MNWQKVKLADITINLDSRRIPLNESERLTKQENGRYPYIGANKIITHINEYIFDEKILCVAEDGGSWGKNEQCSFIINEKCWVNNHAHVLTTKNGTSLEFLKHYLNHADLSRFITGSTRGKLTKSALASIEVPYPSSETQQKIAAILDQADALRQKDQKLLKKYDELLESVFYKMFGDPVRNEKRWAKKSLNECLEFLTSGSRGWAKYYSDKGDIFIRINNVLNNDLNLDNIVYVKAPDTAETKRIRVREGDILLSITADLGRTAVIPKGMPTAFINQHLALLRLKKDFNPVYISHFLSSSGGKLQISKADKGGVKAGLNFNDIKSLEVLLPPFELQQKFSNVFYLIKQERIKALNLSRKSDALFQSLLQKAFKGELMK